MTDAGLHVYASQQELFTWGHINYKASQGKTAVKGKRWHWITMKKTENISHCNYYGRLQIQICISLQNTFSKKINKKSLGELKEILLFLVLFNLRCFMNMGPGTVLVLWSGILCCGTINNTRFYKCIHYTTHHKGITQWWTLVELCHET